MIPSVSLFISAKHLPVKLSSVFDDSLVFIMSSLSLINDRLVQTGHVSRVYDKPQTTALKERHVLQQTKKLQQS